MGGKKPPAGEKKQAPLEVLNDALIYAAEHGDMQFVLQTIMSGEANSLHCQSTLLHHCLKFRNIREPSFLAVLRAYPAAAAVADSKGYYPLHLVCLQTARPTVTMLRALLAEFPQAAAAPSHTGWLPLHLLAKHAAIRGASERPMRASPEMLGCVRAAFPEAADLNAPGNASQAAEDRRPHVLLPDKIPAFKRDRLECLRVLSKLPTLECVSAEKEAREATAQRALSARHICEEALNEGDFDTMRKTLGETRGEFAGVTDYVDPENARMMLHQCLERCADVDALSFEFLFYASPVAPFHADHQGMIPLHVALANVGADSLRPDMLKQLITAHPESLAAVGPHGWLPLHFWAHRGAMPRGAFHAGNVPCLAELLRSAVGKKAAAQVDEAGDLPLHHLCRACVGARLDALDILPIPEESAGRNDGVIATDHLKRTRRKSRASAGDRDAPRDWDAEIAIDLVEMLLAAFPAAWDAVSGTDGKTPTLLAPPELREVIVGYSGKQSYTALQARRASVKQALLLEADLDPRARLCLGADRETSLNKMEALMNAAQGDWAWDGDAGRGSLLHRLLRRKAELPISQDVLRAFLHFEKGACEKVDDGDWRPLHLFARRAIADAQCGTAQNARRLVSADRTQLVFQGGASKHKAAPLHVLVTMLLRRPQPGPAAEDDGAFEVRVLGVLRVLADAGARSLRNAAGKTALEVLPNNTSYDIFREACQPTAEGPKPEAWQRKFSFDAAAAFENASSLSGDAPAVGLPPLVCASPQTTTPAAMGFLPLARFPTALTTWSPPSTPPQGVDLDVQRIRRRSSSAPDQLRAARAERLRRAVSAARPESRSQPKGTAFGASAKPARRVERPLRLPDSLPDRPRPRRASPASSRSRRRRIFRRLSRGRRRTSSRAKRAARRSASSAARRSRRGASTGRPTSWKCRRRASPAPSARWKCARSAASCQ
ncbi:hypothetical protein M885DRAFT_621139 [Pelagophyceae sp. CCMP2097]|nr:hypothetical protein M885DRAFT_621139 [Pelagophyceae sp. CCMP2097]